MSPHLPAAMTLICGTFALVFAVGGNAWGAAFLGFAAGAWLINFVNGVRR